MNGPDAPPARARHAAALAFVFAAAVAVACTWPLATRLTTHYPVWDESVQIPGADQLLTSWILATDARQLAHDPAHLFESNNFHPLRRTITFSENLLGLAILVAPVQYLWDDPVLTDNVALLLALTIAGWGVFLLVREVSGSGLAGLLAGALAIYSPAHWAVYSQLHVISFHWTPVALFALARLVRTTRWRWSVLLGVLVALQAWTSLHHGLFLGLTLAAGIPVLLLGRDARAVLPQIVAGGVLAVVLCVPLALPYLATTREMDLSHRGAAGGFLPSWFVPPLRHPIDYLSARVASGKRVPAVGTLTPWLLVAAGGIAALTSRSRRPLDHAMVAALIAGGVANFYFGLGPARWFGLPSLYTLIAQVPGLGIVRGPIRAATSAYLLLCVLAGCGLGALFMRLRSRMATASVAALVLALTVIEAGWRSVPLAPAPARSTALAAALAELAPGCGYARLPADFEGGALALWDSTVHWRPLVNGYSGFYGIEPFVSFWFLNQFPAPEAIAYLQAAGACAVVVQDSPDRVADVVARSRALGFPVRLAGPDAIIGVPGPAAPPARGLPLPRDAWRIVGPAARDRRPFDDDLGTLWEGSVAAGPQPQLLTLDMGTPARVATIDVDLGYHLRRYLVTYRVDGSLDGQHWATLAENPLAVPPLASYRADPTRIRQRIDLAPATVRYLRIGPLRRPPTGFAVDMGFETWGVAELRVYGPPEDQQPVD
jgi:hypothetical protein